ncbi:hypothetical protein RFI_22052 [Reticulomyxa filosa]|uniref:Uncharacterized protein n=1 Tax=Reticulomyxa filosa TaxID=46433 RepID=X6MNS7_RETFI|nr:hypothetical protein RFI_22052 [Reticulomyxa filosa]|eukprot:ETO15311.1 hypothetical protein RFI_22052 [Reticulomyxa filosa]
MHCVLLLDFSLGLITFLDNILNIATVYVLYEYEYYVEFSVGLFLLILTHSWYNKALFEELSGVLTSTRYLLKYNIVKRSILFLLSVPFHVLIPIFIWNRRYRFYMKQYFPSPPPSPQQPPLAPPSPPPPQTTENTMADMGKNKILAESANSNELLLKEKSKEQPNKEDGVAVGVVTNNNNNNNNNNSNNNNNNNNNNNGNDEQRQGQTPRNNTSVKTKVMMTVKKMMDNAKKKKRKRRQKRLATAENDVLLVLHEEEKYPNGNTAATWNTRRPVENDDDNGDDDDGDGDGDGDGGGDDDNDDDDNEDDNDSMDDHLRVDEQDIHGDSKKKWKKAKKKKKKKKKKTPYQHQWTYILFDRWTQWVDQSYFINELFVGHAILNDVPFLFFIVYGLTQQRFSLQHFILAPAFVTSLVSLMLSLIFFTYGLQTL